jgi:hypothetical protein
MRSRRALNGRGGSLYSIQAYLSLHPTHIKEPWNLHASRTLLLTPELGLKRPRNSEREVIWARIYTGKGVKVFMLDGWEVCLYTIVLFVLLNGYSFLISPLLPWYIIHVISMSWAGERKQTEGMIGGREGSISSIQHKKKPWLPIGLLSIHLKWARVH